MIKVKGVPGLADFVCANGIGIRSGKLVLYKAVSKEWGSLWVRNITDNGVGRSNVYCLGTLVSCRRWNSDRDKGCGQGLHVGTWDCAVYFARNGFLGDFDRRVVEVLVDPEDVVCVPYQSKFRSRHNKKIRCRRLLVAAEMDIKTKKEKSK